MIRTGTITNLTLPRLRLCTDCEVQWRGGPDSVCWSCGKPSLENGTLVTSGTCCLLPDLAIHPGEPAAATP